MNLNSTAEETWMKQSNGKRKHTAITHQEGRSSIQAGFVGEALSLHRWDSTKMFLEMVWYTTSWHKITITIIKKTWLGTLLTRVSLGKNFTKPSRAHVRTVHSVNAQSLKHIQAYSWEVGGKWDQIQREITDWGQWIDGWLEAPWNPWVMVLHLIAFCVCLNYAT